MSDDIRIADFENPQHTKEMLEMMAALDGLPISLDMGTLSQLATEQLDVPLNPGAGYFQRAQSVFSEVEANGDIHSVGRMTLQQVAVDGLVNCSRMEYLHATYQEVSETPVERSIIVAGMPRSGTTHLLKLLSTDATLRTLKRWQTYQSFPSLAMMAGTEPDTREQNGVVRDQISDQMIPYMNNLFDVGASDATEEIEVMGKAFYGLTPSFLGHIPNYDNDFYNKDQSEAYRFLYRYLQALQWVQKGDGADRWLLKSPQHMGALTAVKNVFPDACLVFTHRDPASVFTSLVTLLGYVLRLIYKNPTKKQILEKARTMQHGFLRGIVNHIDEMDGPVEHVYFDRFMKDKLEAVERIFKAAGLNFDSAAEQRVIEQANTHQRGRHGRIVYDLEADFGLTRDQVRDEFSYYLDRFPVAIEESHQ